MSVLYCLNPDCEKPKNEMRYRVCQSCGESLILGKRYVAIKKIGKGGFGVTFLGVDLGNNKSYCVIKQLLTNNQDKETSSTALDLFEREAKTLAKINHPQIPKLLNYFQEKTLFYLIQEFILGQNLEKEIQKKGLFQESTAKSFLKEMLPVLDYIHSQKVIHRDIKPGNILRTKEDKRLILIDFGAVKDQVNTQLIKSNPKTTYTQISIGTMGFAPPEQLAMRPVYASDIYALAATCVYLLTGKAPKDLANTITGQLEWTKYTTVSANFAKILNKMLELDVQKRYNSAQEVIKALEIVPYEQELAGAMVMMKTTTGSDRSHSGLNDTDKPKRGGIASPDLAEAIRKRQERKKRLSLASDNPTSDNKPTTTKLTSEKIIQHYSRGNKNFSQMNLSQMNLESLKLSRASFSQAKLIGTNLEKSNLYKTNFYNANLAQANLKEAYVKKAEFFRANLKSADLQGANLKGANLQSANLKDANLCGANLTGAKVDEEQLKEAKTNWQTIYPNGKRKLW